MDRRPLRPLTWILPDPISQGKSPTLLQKPVTFHLIVSNQWTCWLGSCDMQSRRFWYMSHCQNSYTSECRLRRAAWAFSPGTMEMSHWDVWRATAPFSAPGALWRTQEEIPHSQINNPSPSPRLLRSELLWLPTVSDDNEGRKEGNDFGSDWELIYEGPVNWSLLKGDAYRVARFQSPPVTCDVFMTESNFLGEIFMTVTSVP